MAARELHRRAGAFARADRQLARSVLLGLAMLAAVAVIGPLISYRSDVAELRAEFKARVQREASVYADALARHFELLQAELERLAARPEVNLLDDRNEDEAELMGSAHHHSALFRGGAAVLDSDGRVVWSEPRGVFDRPEGLAGSRWFQNVLAQRGPVVDNLVGTSTFLIAVPVLRAAKITGVMVGVLDATARTLPGGRPVGPNRELLAIDPSGTVFLPDHPPAYAHAPAFLATVERLRADGNGELIEVDGKRDFAAAADVGTTGLRLVLLADEEAVLAPAHARFLAQLIFIAVLQVLTLLLFSAYLSRSYRRFLEVDASAAEQQKLAALGTAASLIAHEVKNSLNGLNAAAALLSGTEGTLAARAIRGQIDRLRHLATSLLHFGKPASPQRVRTRLDRAAEEAVEGLKVLPEAEDVEVTRVVRDPIEVDADPLLLATALDNLIRNAIEASVAAKDLGRVSGPHVHVEAGRRNGVGYVRVEDNAGGPPAGFEDTLFEPFVTTKPKGIGLGLAMARRAVEQQGGALTFERTAAGSAFTVELPLEARS